MQSIADKVRAIIASVLDIDAVRVVDRAHLYVDLGADDLARIEIELECEEAFGLVFEDESFMGLATVGDIIAFIEREAKR